MRVSVRLDDELVNQATAAAKEEFRTVEDQLEFWIKVGKNVLDNPDLPTDFIAESIKAMAEPLTEVTPFIPQSKR